MSEFLKDLSSTAWWIGVVIVGILINIFSAYLNRVLDKSFSQVSGWWADRSIAKKQAQESLIRKLSQSQHEQIMLSIDDLRERLRAVYLLLFGVFFMLVPAFIELGSFGKPIVLGIMAFSYFGSFVIFVEAAKKKANLNRAISAQVKKEDENA